MTGLPEAVIERTFSAPPEMVWRAWTEPQLLRRWYGPNADTIVHRFDLRPGGIWLNEMKVGDESKFQKIVFQEVAPPTRMVWMHHSNTDEQGVDVPIPWMPDWPRIIVTTIGFSQVDDGTRMRLSQVPYDATDAEIAFFTQGIQGLEPGWAQGFVVIDSILSELRTESGDCRPGSDTR